MNVMSNTVKSRFAGMLFGWLRHVENKEAGAPTPAEPRPPAAPTPSRPDGGGELELPLKPILEKLPADLRAKMTMPAAGLARARICIPTEQVLPQLATGAVKITFGQLREAVPDLFRVGTEYDALPVTVPLNEVLALLNPKLLLRSPAQKVAKVSDEITNPFSARTRQTVPAAAPLPANRVAPSNNRFAPSPAPATATPKPVVVQPATAVAMPVQTALPAAKNAAPTAVPAPGSIFAPLAALSEHWPDTMRMEIAQLNLAGAQVALPFDVVQAALKRGQAVFPWRTLRAWIKPAPALVVSIRDNLDLSLPLNIIVPLFMAQCKQPARKTQTAIPMSDIPDLISINSRPSPAEPVPKPVVAPVAIAPPTPAPVPLAPAAPVSRATAPPVPSAPVSTTLPAPTLSPATVLTVSRAPAPLAAAPPQPVSAPKPVVKTAALPAAPAMEIPPVRRATPGEIVKRAMALPGVAGVIVALPDGLSVASQAPEGVDADMLAAFVPQIFDRASQGVTELRMGELKSLSFTAGNVPWVIFRGSMVYFAAFGRDGEALPPGAQLTALAAELDRKKQK